MSKTARVGANSQSLTNASGKCGESHPVPEDVIREFVGHLKLNTVHSVMSRLVVMSEIAEGLLAGELDSDYLDRLRIEAMALAVEQPSPFIKALLVAIEQGEEGLRTLIEAINPALRLAANYTANESADGSSEEIDRLRLAVFRQRQKHRLERAKRLGRLKASALFVRTAGCERLN